MTDASGFWDFARARARIEATPGAAMIIRDSVGSTSRIETTSILRCGLDFVADLVPHIVSRLRCISGSEG